MQLFNFNWSLLIVYFNRFPFCFHFAQFFYSSNCPSAKARDSTTSGQIAVQHYNRVSTLKHF